LEFPFLEERDIERFHRGRRETNRNYHVTILKADRRKEKLRGEEGSSSEDFERQKQKGGGGR